MKPMPVQLEMCATCPWRHGSPHANRVAGLSISALNDGSRICHSTGSNGIHRRTGKPERLCRGARDLQLRWFAAIGFLPEPTDAAWAAKLREIEGLRSGQKKV
jgi:hypothetical protein